MAIYLGEVSIGMDKNSRQHFHFHPRYIYENEIFQRFDISTLLPDSTYKNIDFYPMDLGWKFYDKEICIIEMEFEDLFKFAQTPRNAVTDDKVDIKYQLSVPKLLAENRIHSIDYMNYYRLIRSDEIVGNCQTDTVVSVNNEDIYDGAMVFLEFKQNIALGPFSVKMSMDKPPTINLRNYADKYLVPVVHYSTTDIYDFKFNRYEQTYLKIKIENNDWLDFISDEELLVILKKHLDSDVSNYDSYLISKNVPEKIKEERRSRLIEIMTNETDLDKTFQNIAVNIANIILKYEDKFGDILKILVDKPEFMRQIQNFTIIENKIEDKRSELQAVKDELETLKNQKSDSDKKIVEKFSKENEKLEKEHDDLNKKIKAKRKELSDLKDYSTIQEAINSKKIIERQLDKDIDKLKSTMNDFFKDEMQKSAELVFDGMLSNRMLKAAAAWENNEQAQNYSKIIKNIKSTPEELEKDELIDYLCTQVQRYRPTYNKNMILNIFTCITQNFLTIFSGKPGIGKTSICNIAAKVLGLDKLRNPDDEVDANRFISVSVERGWTSKRDFIGYYNPLTKQFDKSNRQIFDAFNIMDCEAKGNISNLPYMILLDEANLSPMEYYWADFMNICDDLSGQSSINLGEDYRFQIPDFLRFVATINNDNTTVEISPRLIDRAWIIKLPVANSDDLKAVNIDSDELRIISWSSLNKTFNNNDNSAIQFYGEVENIYKGILHFLKEHLDITISPRTDIAIKKYWSTAQSIFFDDNENNVDASIAAFDYAVAQKILPHINVLGQQFGSILNELKNICDKDNLLRSVDILSEMIADGDKNMYYYKYFV